MTKRRRRGLTIELSVGAQVAVAPNDGSAASALDLLRRIEPLLGLMSLATFDSSGLESMSADRWRGGRSLLPYRTPQ